MKKVLIPILFLVLLLLGYRAITIANDRIAEAMEKELCLIPLPEQTELVDSKSYVGRFTGNGNGMQYFAALLINSELNKEELQFYYNSAVENDDVYIIEQEAQIIYEYDIWFDAWNPDPNSKCYRVEMLKESCVGCEKSLWEAILNFDIRGH